MRKLHVSLRQSFGGTWNLPTLRSIKSLWIIDGSWDWMPRGRLVQVRKLIKVGRDTTQSVTHCIKICLQLLEKVWHRCIVCFKILEEGQQRVWFMLHFFKVIDCVLPLRGDQILHPLYRVRLLYLDLRELLLAIWQEVKDNAVRPDNLDISRVINEIKNESLKHKCSLWIYLTWYLLQLLR